MEAPPREKRARAAFFCERAANRSAKKQRKKAKLLAKLEQQKHPADSARPVAQQLPYDLALSSGSKPSPPKKGTVRTARARFGVGASCPAQGRVATQWSASAQWLVVPRRGRAFIQTCSSTEYSVGPNVSRALAGLALIGDLTNGLGSRSSDPGNGVWVHASIIAGT